MPCLDGSAGFLAVESYEKSEGPDCAREVCSQPRPSEAMRCLGCSPRSRRMPRISQQGQAGEGPEAFGWWKVGERQEFRRNAAVLIVPLVAVVLVLTR